MNERIRELAKKSGFSLDSTGIYTAKLEHLPITENMEKFAELIVRECMTVARGADGLDATHEAWYLIKEHFGVEE
jgi:hypothetical protein